MAQHILIDRITPQSTTFVYVFNNPNFSVITNGVSHDYNVVWSSGEHFLLELSDENLKKGEGLHLVSRTGDVATGVFTLFADNTPQVCFDTHNALLVRFVNKGDTTPTWRRFNTSTKEFELVSGAQCTLTHQDARGWHHVVPVFEQAGGKKPGSNTQPKLRLTECYRDRYESIEAFGAKHAAVKRGDEEFFIDVKGAVQAVRLAAADASGLLSVVSKQSQAPGKQQQRDPNKLAIGILDSATGEFVVPLQYDAFRRDRTGSLQFRRNSKWFRYDTTERKLDLRDQFGYMSAVVDGAAIAQLPDGKKCFVGAMGEMLFRDSFDEAQQFSEGFAVVRNGGDWYHIRKSDGKPAYYARFDHLESFVNGRARACADRVWFDIDHRGDEV